MARAERLVVARVHGGDDQRRIVSGLGHDGQLAGGPAAGARAVDPRGALPFRRGVLPSGLVQRERGRPAADPPVVVFVPGGDAPLAPRDAGRAVGVVGAGRAAVGASDGAGRGAAVLLLLLLLLVAAGGRVGELAGRQAVHGVAEVRRLRHAPHHLLIVHGQALVGARLAVVLPHQHLAFLMQLSANNNHPHQLMVFFMQLSANNHRHQPNGTFMQLSANNNHPHQLMAFFMQLSANSNHPH